MSDLQILTSDAEQHKAATMAVGMWIMREIPVLTKWIKGTLWPKLVYIYPYCSTHGGIIEIIKSFFVGYPVTKPISTSNSETVQKSY